MTILSTPPPPAALFGSCLEVDALPVAQGDDGRLVQRHLQEAIRHWNARTEFLLTLDEPELEFPATYRHIPFERVGTVSVRYAPPRPLRPRRIITEDFTE